MIDLGTNNKQITLVGLTQHDRTLIQLALEGHIEMLRNRFQGDEYNTKYIHPAIAYEKLLIEIEELKTIDN